MYGLLGDRLVNRIATRSDELSYQKSGAKGAYDMKNKLCSVLSGKINSNDGFRLNSLYSVGFLCQLLFDINWFILEYIINCIGKCLQILVCLVKLFASICLSLFIVFVLLFISLPFW